MRKLKETVKNLNNKFLFGRYNLTFKYINKKANIKDYIFKFILIYGLMFFFLYLIFNSMIYSGIFSFVLTIFFINEIFLNSKKIFYEDYILSQLTIYTSQMSLLVTFNNIYSAIKNVIKYVDEPIKSDLRTVVFNIDNGMAIAESFNDFNRKYNNRTITLFNQTLELFDQHGDSDAGTVLHIISEEMNMLKIKKDKYLRFKKEWRLNFYVVVFMSLLMPIILKLMIPDIYADLMTSFGSLVMGIIIAANLFIIKKVEGLYRDQSIGEEGVK